MQRHFSGLVVAYSFILVGFVFGLAFDSIAIALASLVSGLVAAFVTAIALLRADGHSLEHYAYVNRVLDDVTP